MMRPSPRAREVSASSTATEDLRAGPLAILPHGKGFLHRVFLVLKASALDGLTNKCLLVRGELHFHRLQRMGRESRCQGCAKQGGLKQRRAQRRRMARPRGPGAWLFRHRRPTEGLGERAQGAAPGARRSEPPGPGGHDRDSLTREADRAVKGSPHVTSGGPRRDPFSTWEAGRRMARSAQPRCSRTVRPAHLLGLACYSMV